MKCFIYVTVIHYLTSDAFTCFELIFIVTNYYQTQINVLVLTLLCLFLALFNINLLYRDFFEPCIQNTCLSYFTDKFNFKQEDRFECATKAGDVFATQRRYPQPLFWDYKVRHVFPDNIHYYGCSYSLIIKYSV